MKSLDDSVELCTQELTFNPSFYPSLVRMPMSRYRRNIWKPMARYRRNIWKSGGPSEVELMPMAEDLPSLPTVAGQL